MLIDSILYRSFCVIVAAAGSNSRFLSCIVGASLLPVLALACSGSGTAPTFTPEPTPTLVIVPFEGPVVCAAASTDRFTAAQEGDVFRLYCPTYLPEGFALTDIKSDLPVVSSTEAGVTRAVFSRAEPAAEVMLVQGRPAFTELTELVRGKEPLEVVPYSDFPADLFAAVALARSPDGYTHIIIIEDLSTEELTRIAAGMQPVPEVGPSPTP